MVQNCVGFCDATGALLGSSLGGGGALIGGAYFSALGASCAYVVPRPELLTKWLL